MQKKSTKKNGGETLFRSEKEKCAQKGFDRADIVIALGKRGRGGTEDEAVKPLDGVQRVKVPHGQSEHAGR